MQNLAYTFNDIPTCYFTLNPLLPNNLVLYYLLK